MTSFDDGIISFDQHGCCIRAHAKLNVTLEVLGRRDDGFHEVAHVMQLLELHDVIALRTLEEDVIRFTSTETEIDPKENLAVAAAAALKKRFAVSRGVEIELDKHIPIAAGLGGGSSDAAAVLVALSRLWKLSISPLELVEVAASLGSDVPFFFVGGLALCEGRGERVRALPSHWPESMRWLLLMKPAAGVPTAEAFQGFSPKYYVDGSHSRGVCRLLEEGKEFDASHLENRMANSVFERYPEVAQARDAMLFAGAPVVELCGTGSAVFAPFERLEAALRVRRRLLSRKECAPSTIILTRAHHGRA